MRSFKSILIPSGCAHGFLGLDKENIVETQNLIQDAIKILNIPGIIVTHNLEHLQDIDTRMIIKI